MKDKNSAVIFENAEKLPNTITLLFSDLLKITTVYFQIPALLNMLCFVFSEILLFCVKQNIYTGLFIP